MTERGVPDVVSQGDVLDQVFIEPQQTADGAGDFGDQLYMQHAMGDMVMFDQVKDLGLVDVTGIGLGMQNPVRIQRKMLAMAFSNLGFVFTAHGLATQAGKRG